MIGDILARLQQVEDRLSRLSHLYSQSIMAGPVAERDHEKGVRLDLGTEDQPFLTPWIQPGDRTGASRYLPEKGEQVMLLAPGGDHRQATMVPFTHSDGKKNPAKDADETVHHARDGQRSSVKKGHVRDQADKAHSKFVGDEPTGGGSGGQFPHELNRQLAGIRANLTQHENQIAGLHDATSKFREIVQNYIPPVVAVMPLLKGDPQSLEAAAQGVLGKLQGYMNQTMQQMVGKLTSGLLDNVMAGVTGGNLAQLAGMLDQAQDLIEGHGLEDLAGDLLGEARGMLDGAAQGNTAALGAKLDQIGSVLAGTPAEAAYGLLKGNLAGALGSIGSIMAGLGDLTDGQKNLTKGMTKSYRLGGYGIGE